MPTLSDGENNKKLDRRMKISINAPTGFKYAKSHFHFDGLLSFFFFVYPSNRKCLAAACVRAQARAISVSTKLFPIIISLSHFFVFAPTPHHITHSTHTTKNTSAKCWCGGQRTDFDVHGPSTGCTSACAGNTGEICGGSFAMSVYENDGGGGGTPPATPSPIANPTPAPVVGSTPAPIMIITPAPVIVVEERTPSPIRIINSMETPAPIGQVDPPATPAPSGQVDPPPAGAFLGCFADMSGNRIMSDGPNNATPMSAEVNNKNARREKKNPSNVVCPYI